jgi:hypothetical protein
MSLDETTIKNTMIQTPPAKKGFHFASDGIHFAEFIEAATIEEATAIYQKVKRVMSPAAAPAEAPAVSAPTQEQSTPSPEEQEENNS